MTSERSGIGFAFWVLGWSLIVGFAGFVVPAYVVFGSVVAAWVLGFVLTAASILCWLSVEASAALNESTGQKRTAPGMVPSSRS